MSTVINFTVGAVANLISIHRISPLGLNWSGAVLAPVGAAAVGGIVGSLVFSQVRLGLASSLALAALAVFVVYFFLLLTTASGQRMFRRLLAINPFTR